MPTDTIPSFDWDLSEIWYATSQDGFSWLEQGPAVKRAPKGQYGWRSVSTPDVLGWGGRYYLYYQDRVRLPDTMLNRIKRESDAVDRDTIMKVN